MLLQPVPVSITVASAAGSGNTLFMRGLTRLIYCKPVAETYSYTLTLTDPDSRVVFSTDVVGTLRNTEPLPVKGVYTVSISGASNDGAYAFYMMVEERRA